MEHLLGALFAIIRAIHPCNHFNVLNTQNYNLASGKCPSHKDTHSSSLHRAYPFAGDSHSHAAMSPLRWMYLMRLLRFYVVFLKSYVRNLLNHKIIIELLNNRFEIAYGHCDGAFVAYVRQIEYLMFTNDCGSHKYQRTCERTDAWANKTNELLNNWSN